jgi:hypothetical protein
MLRMLAGLLVAAGVAVATSAGAASVEAYGKLPAIEPAQFDLSPQGDRIAFVANANGGRQLIVRELTGATLISINISMFC